MSLTRGHARNEGPLFRSKVRGGGGKEFSVAPKGLNLGEIIVIREVRCWLGIVVEICSSVVKTFIGSLLFNFLIMYCLQAARACKLYQNIKLRILDFHSRY